MSLEAIRYSSGSLQLLDQRRLPAESVYIPISNVEDGWNAIREMAVRGAPAIGVTAALSLAVELTTGGNGAQFASVGEAVDFIAAKLDHLVSSRPTGVNILDTSSKIKALCSAEKSQSDATPAGLVKCVVEACEKMLGEDVRTNKAIGQFGAESIMEIVSSKGLGVDGKVRILTHCNAGSLATAGYGTALGVIRALHEAGKLEHAYCTETRPYNQGARLTAYELVHDGLPSTLICDSMAASLMSLGKVDAVVVGADRIASNGDAANKIGTLCLAILASHFGIPFFFACPSTSFDLDMEDGSEISIEERPSVEMTHFRGQLVTPKGIGIWNPAFDVTPASLTEGIITEKGTIVKSSHGAFKVREFFSEDMANGHTNGVSAVKTPPGFFALNEESLKSYVLSKPELAKVMGPDSATDKCSVREVGDGNINFVYIVESTSGSLVIKQGLPYVRCVGESWPLTQDRVRLEAESLMVGHKYCPSHVPEVYLYDEKMAVIAMENLAPPHIILRKGIVQGAVFPKVADHIVDFLAATLFNTSLLAVGSKEFRDAMVKSNNPEMCKLTEQVIFLDPYYGSPLNRWTSPQLDEEVNSLVNDADAKTAIADLRRKFLAQPEALIHGDLHTGSLMVTQDTTYSIDSEFAYYGPMGFDVGKIIGNFLLAFFAIDGHSTEVDPRKEQRRWLLNSAQQIWTGFSQKFLELWEANKGKGALYPTELIEGGAFKAIQDEYMAKLWRETVGFCGSVLIRRLVGIAHIEDMDSIENPDTRAVCERRALRFGRLLLTKGEMFPDIETVVAKAEEFRNDGSQPYYQLE